MVERDDDEALTLHPDDDPFVRQMKLLRRDLRDDRDARVGFEKRMRWAVGSVAALTLLTAATFGLFVLQLRNEQLRDCKERAVALESSKVAIIKGNVTTVLEVGRAFGAEEDPRLADAAAQTATSNRKQLDTLLPPVAC